MKRQTKIIASVLSLCAMSYASAADFDDTARVVRSVPHMQQISRPHQECQTVMVPTTVQPPHNPAGAIVGGIAGGVVGHQFGRGTGNTAATVLGAVGGAIAGDQIANQNNTPVTSERAVQECRRVDVMESRPAGYEVTYTYRGKSFTTILPYEPGETITVRVTVRPI